MVTLTAPRHNNPLDCPPTTATAMYAHAFLLLAVLAVAFSEDEPSNRWAPPEPTHWAKPVKSPAQWGSKNPSPHCWIDQKKVAAKKAEKSALRQQK